jgi:DNA-directed RNA polymerase specialized sigma24 family protein
MPELTRREKLALILHDQNLLPDREIAARFGVGRSAITMRRNRALAKLPPETRARYLAELRRRGVKIKSGK